MSTLRPRRSSRSSTRAAWSRRLWPGSNSTRRSISLPSPASPRAADPNTRTLYAPCLAQTHRIASRFSLSRSSRAMPQLLQILPDRFVQPPGLSLLFTQLRCEPPHLLLERFAVVRLRLGPDVAAGREHMAVLADVLQRGALAEAGDVVVCERFCALTLALSRRERG